VLPGSVCAPLQDIGDLLADKAALTISTDIDFGLHQLQKTDTNTHSPISIRHQTGMYIRCPHIQKVHAIVDCQIA